MKKLFSVLFLLFAFATFSFGQTLANPVNVTATGVRSYTYTGTLLKNVVVTNHYMTSTAFSDLRLQIDLDTVAAGALSVSTIVYGSLDKVNWTTLTGNLTDAISLTFNADSTITGTTGTTTSTITTAGATSATSNVRFSNLGYNYIKIVSTSANQTQYALFRYKVLFVKYD